MDEREKLHMRFTAVWWSVLFLTSMCLMLVTANRKLIVIMDGSYGQGVVQEGEQIVEQERRMELSGSKEDTGVFRIPLEKKIKAEDVVVENRYMDRELHIFIEGAGEEFYEACSVLGDVSPIRSAGWERQHRGILLKFYMDGVYEYRTRMDADMLHIEVCSPREMYRMLVVVDTAPSKLSKISADVCRLLYGQMNNENIRLYFTGAEDVEIPAEAKLDFVEEVQPDLFLQVGLSEGQDASRYGICGRYNESYFIPEFGNVEWADIVTRNVTVTCGNRAVGLVPADEDSILQDIRIPAAGVELGNPANEREGRLLLGEAYQEKLAQGIAAALREVYAEYYE
ncbi:MAG: N-acetylmuramoyl-L-alanine amidase [Clostridium sp.]|nr:N-acetylmuramoyl-L-alanine amidase [Acetatifactor muris]MCM1526855.1 N-acetylmuramoyl-L-alanine amidase [Bacteroides sp.]MCM1562945.1 N-acetylmuramoyl-L-alanine amidase [Clostridium sp.]